VGGKGPAIMLIKGQSQYRQAYIYAIQQGNWLSAVDSIIGMASILPIEAKYPIPQPPHVLFEGARAITPSDSAILKKWCVEEKARVEQAISQYVYRFYKTWSGVNL